jgi:hypothetical protein
VKNYRELWLVIDQRKVWDSFILNNKNLVKGQTFLSIGGKTTQTSLNNVCGAGSRHVPFLLQVEQAFAP